MARRWARLLLLILLLVIGGAAAAFSAFQARHIDELGRSALATSHRVDELSLTLQNIRDAQRSYLVISGTHAAANEVSTLLASVTDEITEIDPNVYASRSKETLTSLRASADALARIETKARDHVRLGQDLMAAELISTEAEQTLNRMSSTLNDFRSAELSAIDVSRAAILQQVWPVIGGAAATWLLGLVVLVRVPKLAAAEPMTTAVPAVLSIAEAKEPPRPPLHPLAAASLSPHADDLRQTADVCTAIGQITDAQELQPLLSSAASALGASGVVVWMAAGEELIAASAFGYESTALHRLGRIHRSGFNATAVAWRSGTLQIVSGEGTSRAAMVAPMLGAERCVGVLAIEVPQGGETDETRQAIARLVAAQLAATLAPWPAASVANSVETFEKAAEG